ncbi:MAG: [protein-PII] uridylyltransferase [Planctomycetaceae bacterium]|nr:[protein-PII] uridylyltransferase [Planctomycetaceae bacterium]
MSSHYHDVNHSPKRRERLRRRVKAINKQARELFQRTAAAFRISEAISRETDRFLLETLKESMEMLPAEERASLQDDFALIAVGGTGRRDPAPYSDVDLLFLLSDSASPVLNDWISQVVRDYWDAGLKLGHAVRTVSECVRAALDDNQIATALLEMRFLWGSQHQYSLLAERFRHKVIDARKQAFCEECIANREEEQQKHGGAVLSLVPDVKRSRGGLRDWHFLRWMTFAECGSPDPQKLVDLGVMTKDDLMQLRHSVEFLSRIRIDLHFQAEKSQDVLTRDEQLRLSEKYGFQATIGERPVERLMRHYFRYALAISQITKRLQSRYERKPLAKRLVGLAGNHQEEDGFLITWDGLDVKSSVLSQVLTNSDQLIRLFYLSAHFGQLPKPELIEKIRRSITGHPFQLTETGASRFRDILRCGPMLAPILRSMDEAGLLELIIPDFANVHCLLQFNQYHAYTVDEHTFRAVEELTRLKEDETILGRVYRSIKQPEVVHLAMILHDLGKGFDEDHSEVGTRIAERISERLGFSESQQAQVMLLVRIHLLMANTAFWRDTTDPKVLIDFSREVGSLENLKMLFVLTKADVTSVGPGVWTDWKSELLTGLYERTEFSFTSEGGPLSESKIRDEKRNEILDSLLRDTSIDPEREEDWLAREFETLPLHYLVETSAREIALDLENVTRLKPESTHVEGTWEEETGLVEYRVYVSPDLAPGCFHRIAGALTGLRMNIMTARLCTTSRGWVIDRFLVEDNDFQGEVPYERVLDVSRTLEKVIRCEQSVLPMLNRGGRFQRNRETTPYAQQPTRLVIDNDSSDRCTVIDVFAIDRPGLLYALSRVIFQCGYSVDLAKIGTHLEQIVDVFYITTPSGEKVEDEESLRKLKQELKSVLDSLDDEQEASELFPEE